MDVAMLSVTLASVLLLACFNAEASVPTMRQARPSYDHGVDLPTTRPLILAHRGSSGTLPEHTVAAYQLAVDQGADVVECDVTVSKDLALLCMHEPWMNQSTNVAQVYPTRAKTYFVLDQNVNITDYFAADFTLDELTSKVRTRQRLSFRDPSYDYMYPIATLKELISVAQGANRPVGIYVETKLPLFINSLEIIKNASTTFEDLLLNELKGFGYQSERSPCFLQSFNENSLKYMADRTSLPAIILTTSAVDITDEDLERYATFAYGIGPDKRKIVRTNSTDHITERTDLVDRAHARGLRVHPFTLRNENQYLAWDYGQDPANEYADYFNIGVDGIFTDFPETYFNFLNHAYCDATSSSPSFHPMVRILLVSLACVTSWFQSL